MPIHRSERRFVLVTSIAFTALLLLLLLNLLSPDPFTEEVNSDYVVRTGNATEYCNFPGSESKVGASEGVHPDGTELVSVAVVLRHGDRYQLESTRLGSLRSPPVSCKLSVRDDSHPLLGKFITDMNKMSRSGRRAGTTYWEHPPYPNSTLCRPEHLSPAGVEQHLRNGLLLRKAYSKKINLRKVTVRSTGYMRTYQSALAFLYGLNRKLSWAHQEIERVGTSSFCNTGFMGDCTCPYVETLSEAAYGQVKSRWQDEDVAFSMFSERAYGIINEADVRPEYPWMSALDFLAQFACRKHALPCKHGQCFQEEDFNLLWDHVTFHQRKLEVNEAFQRKCHIEMHPLLAEIATHMNSFQLAAADTPSPMLVYSGHDITLTPLAIALGIPLGQWPPYASRFVIEHYRDLTGDRHYIRTLFNGEDVTRLLHFCRDDDNGLCPLEDFVEFSKYRSLRKLGYRGWRAACYDIRHDPHEQTEI